MAQIYSANLWSQIPPNGTTPHYIETTARLADNGLMVAETEDYGSQLVRPILRNRGSRPCRCVWQSDFPANRSSNVLA